MEPDVLCLQETKLANDAFPALTFEAMGYQSVHHGEGRWNGVAILSRVGLDDVGVDFADGGEPDTDARIVWATCGGVRVASCYIPNGRSLDDDHYQYKLAWLARLRAHLDQACSPTEPVALLRRLQHRTGGSRRVGHQRSSTASTHVTPPEREAFGELLDWGLHDVFRDEYPDDDGLYTYWDYTAGSVPQARGHADRLRAGVGRRWPTPPSGCWSIATPARATSPRITRP